MDQFSIDLCNRSDIDILRDALVKEINNPEYTKYLVVEKNKDETISIRAKTFLTAKIKLSHKTKFIVVRTKNLDCFKDNILLNSSSKFFKDDQSSAEAKEWSRIPIKTLDDVLSLIKPLSVIYMLVLSELGGESFGCCSRYVQCSNARRCINPNYLMSLACTYKHHLEAGRIFYGINKNII